jgi:hypothetical protein
LGRIEPFKPLPYLLETLLRPPSDNISVGYLVRSTDQVEGGTRTTVNQAGIVIVERKVDRAVRMGQAEGDGLFEKTREDEKANTTFDQL